MELDFAGLAVAGLDGVDDARARVGRDREAVDEDEDRLGEVEFEEDSGVENSTILFSPVGACW